MIVGTLRKVWSIIGGCISGQEAGGIRFVSPVMAGGRALLHRMKAVSACLFVSGMLLGIAPGGAIHWAHAMDRTEVVDQQRLIEYIQAEMEPKLSEREAAQLARIEAAVQGDYDWSAIQGRRMMPLTPQEAALSALRHNLSLRIAEGERAKVAELLREAQSVFDPVLEVALRHSDSETYRRAKFGQAKRRNFIVRPNPMPIPVPPNSEGEAKVSALGFRDHYADELVFKEIEASQDSEFSADRNTSYEVILDQVLPWGGSVRVANVMRYHKSYYREGYAYDDRWASDLYLTFETPLPWTREFGADGPLRTAIEQAELARERGEWELRATVNAILLAVDVAYWRLVGSIEELRATEALRDISLDQLARVQRRFDLQLTTRYRLMQAEADAARAQSLVEEARAAYLVASTALANLLVEQPRELAYSVLVPYGFSEHLRERMPADLQEALARMKEQRPDLILEDIGTRSAAIGLRTSANLTRPDLRMLASLKSGQDNSVMGFSDPGKAYGRTFAPDTFDQSYMLSFNRPWGNRAANAALRAAEVNLNEIRPVSEAYASSLAGREVYDALSGMDAARALADLRQLELTAAENAYAALIRQQEVVADVTQNEIILSMRKIYDADISLVRAWVANKQAESQLLAAQGVLLNEYARRHAGDFELYRLQALADADQLSYFAPLSARDVENE